jgi:hypothetical protein
MRDSDDDSFDPAMDCIIDLEEQRLGRSLNSREIDALVQRFARDNQSDIDSSDAQNPFVMEQMAKREYSADFIRHLARRKLDQIRNYRMQRETKTDHAGRGEDSINK